VVYLNEHIARNEQVCEYGHGVDECHESDDDHSDRQDSTGRVERMRFTVANSAERDNGHVDGVDPTVALHDHVADDGERGQEEKDEQGPPKTVKDEGNDGCIPRWRDVESANQ
jgi:hypothetical protein